MRTFSDIFDFYQNWMDKALTVAEEESLIKEAQAGNTEAQNKLLKHNMPGIIKFASKHRVASPDDLVQVAALSFIKAIQSYKFGYGCRLIAYSSWVMKSYLYQESRASLSIASGRRGSAFKLTDIKKI